MTHSVQEKPLAGLPQPATHSNLERLKTLEHRFNEQLIGQPQAVAYVSEMVQRIISGFYDEKVPLGVFLFAGSTGVGKTELAKMVAEELDWPLHRYDMSEFQKDHTVSRFLGSPPGYVDSPRGGELVNALNRSPRSVVLFDEVEKAHPDITRIFLQLFDEGRLTDSMGNEVSTTHAIFIMTTNLGPPKLYERSSPAVIHEKLKTLFIQRFSSELFGRLHRIVVFNALDSASIAKIAEKYFVRLVSSIEKRTQIKMTWDQSLVAVLLKDHKNLGTGARGVHRQIQESLFKALTFHYLSGTYDLGDSIHLASSKTNQLAISLVAKRAKPASLPTPAPSSIPAPLSRKEGVIYMDRRGVTAKELVGKYAIRLPGKGDQSYTGSPVKIALVSQEGEIIIDDDEDDRKGWQHRLSPKWNDDQWILPTPATCAKSFFMNLCMEIKDPLKKKEGIQLIREILRQTSLRYLSNEPFIDLEDRCRLIGNKVLLNDLYTLEDLLGPVRVELVNVPQARPDHPPGKDTSGSKSQTHYRNYTSRL